MALLSPTEPRYRITTADHGNYKALGEALPGKAGAWHIAFAPDDSFVGELLITGRSVGKGAHDDAVGFGTVAYRRVQLAGGASDYALVQTTGTPVPLAGDFIVLVPAAGLSIAIAVLCTAGFGFLYTRPIDGSPAP